MTKGQAENLGAPDAASPNGSLIARDGAVFLHQKGSSPVGGTVAVCEDSWLTDVEGRRILDFHGNSCHNVGYRHPRVIAAVIEQLKAAPFCPRRFTNAPSVALAERLAALWPYGPARVLFAPSGSDAIEIALKLAYVATGRRGTLAFEGAWHGAGIGAISVGGRFHEATALPRLAGCRHLPAFWASDAESDAEAAARRALAALEAALTEDGEVAALLAAPIHSCPGIPPDWFWPAVRALCDRHGSLLIFDEIPVGLGRTGCWFASSHFAVRPDITVLGKALGGGIVPLAAVIARADLNLAGDYAIGHITHEKNPVVSAAGLAVLDVLAEEGLIGRAASLGVWFGEQLCRLSADTGGVAEVAGRGLLWALRFGRDRAPLATAVEHRALDWGLNVSANREGAVVLSPPLSVTEGELAQALEILAAILARPPA